MGNDVGNVVQGLSFVVYSPFIRELMHAINYKKIAQGGIMGGKRIYPLVRTRMNGDVEIREILYEDGKTENIFRRKGKILPKIPLSGHIIDQLRAMYLIEKDLRNVIQWVEIVKNTAESVDLSDDFMMPNVEKNSIMKSLLVSLVTFYGKCFTEANDRRFSLHKKNVPGDLKWIHEKIMNLRHNFAAHKGEFEMDECRFSLVIVPGKQSAKFEIYSTLTQINHYLQEDEMSALVELCNRLREHVVGRINKALELVKKEKVYPKGLDYWLERNGKKTSVT
jgi:hypothetical protein